jgi:predicted RNA-binding Zn-ribbon protein involved in translation (DUF1610 family)
VKQNPKAEIKIAMLSCCVDALAKFGASCLFGCATSVDNETRRCATCKDHSADAFMCDECGSEWEKWGDTFDCTRRRRCISTDSGWKFEDAPAASGTAT